MFECLVLDRKENSRSFSEIKFEACRTWTWWVLFSMKFIEIIFLWYAGGKSPLIICEDADSEYSEATKTIWSDGWCLVDYAVSVAYRAIFTNAAQNCTAGSRTFVHAKIYDEFIAKSVELAKNRIVGDPFDPMTEQGPQVWNSTFLREVPPVDSSILDHWKSI